MFLKYLIDQDKLVVHKAQPDESEEESEGDESGEDSDEAQSEESNVEVTKKPSPAKAKEATKASGLAKSGKPPVKKG